MPLESSAEQANPVNMATRDHADILDHGAQKAQGGSGGTHSLEQKIKLTKALYRSFRVCRTTSKMILSSIEIDFFKEIIS